MSPEYPVKSTVGTALGTEGLPFEVFFTLEGATDHAVILLELSTGRIIAVNPAFRSIFHYPNEEALRFPKLATLTSVDHSTKIHAYLQESLKENQKLLPIRVSFSRADGTEFATDLSAIVFREHDRGVVLIRPKELDDGIKSLPLYDSAAYRGMVEHLTDVVYALSPSGLITYLNPAFEKISGWTCSEWIGRSFFLLADPTEMTKIMHHLGLLYLGVPMEATSFRILKKNGDYAVGEATAFPRMEGGTLVEILGSVRIEKDAPPRVVSIPTLKTGSTESALMESVLGLMDDAAVVLSSAGQFLYSNPKADQLFGSDWKSLGESALIENSGVYIDERRTPISPDQCPVRQAQQGKFVGPMDLYLENAQVAGGRWVSCSGVPLFDDSKKLFGAALYFHDITEHKRLESALRASQLLYRSLIENLPLSVFRKDRMGRFVFVNRVFCGMVNRELEQIVGKSDSDLFPPELAQKYRNDDKRVMDTGSVLEDIEPNVSASGAPIQVHVVKGPVYDSRGNIAGIQGASWDVTHRIQEQEELTRLARDLKRSNSELEQFAYVASHDLKEPLRMISCYIKLLSTRYSDKPLDENAKEFLKYAIDGSERMRALIDELLRYSRVGRADEPMVTINIESVVKGVLGNLSLLIEEAGATIDIGPMPEARVQASLIARVFENLMSNALKFRGKNPVTIQVRASRLDSEWLFMVKDNGIGIDKKDFRRIFLLFQKLHERNQYVGSGIGLSICKKIIERQGGKIWVESELGRGSAFFFTVPVTARIDAL